MPRFDNINTVYTPERKMGETELLRAVKFGIASEYEAAQIYQLMMESTDNREVRTILQSIADDEMHHAGKLAKLLEMLSPEDARQFQIGVEKAEQLLGQSSGTRSAD